MSEVFVSSAHYLAELIDTNAGCVLLNDTTLNHLGFELQAFGYKEQHVGHSTSTNTTYVVLLFQCSTGREAPGIIVSHIVLLFLYSTGMEAPGIIIS